MSSIKQYNNILFVAMGQPIEFISKSRQQNSEVRDDVNQIISYLILRGQSHGSNKVQYNNNSITVMIKSNPPQQHLSYENGGALPSDTSRLQALQKREESLWQTIRENVSDAKKEFKALNEHLKEELSTKLRLKAEVVDDILRTLDSKIQFVIESCQKYGNRIMQHVSAKAAPGDSVDTQQYSQRFELITQKMRVLEQRLFGFKQNEEELKSRVEILKDKNNQLSEDYRLLTIRSNERIAQIEHQLREKDHQLKEKTEELRKKENNQAIKFTFVHPSPPVTQQIPVAQNQIQPQPQAAHKPKPQQSSGVAHYNPQVIQQPPPNTHQPKKQNTPKQVIPHTPIQYEAKPPQSQPFADNNSIQIRPDFFRSNTELAGNKGINLRSIREQNLMSARKPARENESEMSDSQYHRGGGNSRQTGGRSELHDHRFDYLMSNLVGTQADSSNPQFTEESRVSSRMSGYQSSYMHR